jgi:hypothetical protein
LEIGYHLVVAPQMKSILTYLVTLGMYFIPVTVHATEVTIFNQHIIIDPGCHVEIVRANQRTDQVKLPFENKGVCDVLTYLATDVPHIELIHGAYVLLVESRNVSPTRCTALYTAIVVHPNGTVEVVPSPRPTGTCGSDRDRFQFEFLFNQLQRDSK